jgi:calcineurin-like phosphoesterase family protein
MVKNLQKKAINVSVDMNSYCPISIEEIIEKSIITWYN